ncbi:MAG: molybdenum cofactor guanylyltransferase [Desulfitobacterium hafniense]|nr:molybdenum cofactor guanylyltransferase [Desulfitobacterium hafniense]
MTGIILAGGKSSRMAKNKAFLELDGRPLIERSIDILNRIFDEVIISSNDQELYNKYGVDVIPDVHKNRGPLGGLHACFLAAKHEVCFFVACDMPFLNSEVIRYLSKFTDEFQAVVPKLENGLEPLHAFYRKEIIFLIESNLKNAKFKIIDFYPQVNIKYIIESELRLFSNPDKDFLNANTPEDWHLIKELFKNSP